MAITNFIPELWAGAIISSFKEAEVVSPFVNRSYEGSALSGNQVNITGLSAPSVQDYLDPDGDEDPTKVRTHNVSTLTDSAIALAIDQEKVIAFKVDDVDRMQAAGSFDQVTSDAASALVEDAEAYILDVMKSGGTAAGSDPVNDASSAYKAAMGIRTAMGEKKVPMSDRYLAVNPVFASYLLSSSLLGSANFAGDQLGTRNGVIGTFLGFTVLETSLLEPEGTATAAAVGFHGPSVAYVNQIQSVEAVRSQNSFADIVRLLHVYGAKVLRATAVQTWLPTADDDEE